MLSKVRGGVGAAWSVFFFRPVSVFETGLVRFTDLPEKRALVEIDFDGLAPNLKHAVGVHRSGNVSGAALRRRRASLTAF